MNNEMHNILKNDPCYSEWSYERDLEDIRAMEEDYWTGQHAADLWDLRHPDWSFDNYLGNLPF